MPRVTCTKSSWLTLLSLCLSVSIFFLSVGFSGFTQAQVGGVDTNETVATNPKIRLHTVTARVPDNAAPSTPILISPSNNSILTDNTPTFVWEGATDDIGISKYILFIDGSIFFDNIPTSSTVTSDYVLAYDSGTNRYSLTPTATLTEGTHTWKIQVWDTSSHSTDSVTWTFTIDSTAPNFVITQVGTAATAISAQDISTIPTAPLVLTANEPLILATGEATSTVQTTVIIPGYPTQNFATQIDASGNWSLQLGILPRGLVMTMNLLITDVAGNISVLNGVEFLIEQDVIIFPPVSPSPTPSPSNPPGSPEPSSSPTPGVTPIPSQPPAPPESPRPTPLLIIPVTPPREIVYIFLQDIFQALPPLLQNALESLTPLVKDLAPVSAGVVALSIPLVSTVAVASQFGGSLSPTLFLKILQALGLLPIGKPQGLVFNSETDEGIPFAILTFRNQDPNTELSIVETVVTNTSGVYQGINLPAGLYQIEVSHQDFRFPTQKKRAVHLGVADYYKGEEFSLTNTQEPLFLIPMDPLVSRLKHRWGLKIRLLLASFSRRSSVVVYPLAFLSVILVILFPTIWNWLVVGFYGLLLTQRIFVWFRVPIVTGQVLDERGQPMSKVIVRLATIDENSLAAVLLTDQNGEFKYYGRPALYQLALQKSEYIWMDGASPLSFYEVDVRAKRQHVLASLTPLQELYSQMMIG